MHEYWYTAYLALLSESTLRLAQRDNIKIDLMPYNKYKHKISMMFCSRQLSHGILFLLFLACLTSWLNFRNIFNHHSGSISAWEYVKINMKVPPNFIDFTPTYIMIHYEIVTRYDEICLK